MLADLDLMIRGAVIGLSMLTFALLWLTPHTRCKSYAMGAIAVTLTAHMAQAQGMSAVWSDAARGLAVTIGNFMPIALTWFVLEMFLERKERRSPAARALLGFACLTVLVCGISGGKGPVLISMLVILDLGLLALVLLSARGDLVEGRRSFRVVFVPMMLAFGITKTVLDSIYGPDGLPIWADTAYAGAILMFVLVFCHWALRPGRDIWLEEPEENTVRPQPAPADHYVLRLIETAMRDELWRREGLTIGGMAEEIGTPEHRLRKAINRDLGFRNFSTFVNSYRIDAAKAALAAPENAQTTILEIAYDVGFASLGPFNKAFRAMTGTSPRDYRRSAFETSSFPA